MNLGSAILNTGDAKGALALFDTALVLAPMLPPARFNRARALDRLGRAPEAETELRLVLAVAPPERVGIVVDLLSRTLAAQGRYAEAEAVLSGHLASHEAAHQTR